VANTALWFYTRLPSELIDPLHSESNRFQDDVQKSVVRHGGVIEEIRKSKNAWIPTSNWIGGFLWHYVERSNRENFLYDLTGFENEIVQYTVYEKGDYYGWHTDTDLSASHIPRSAVFVNDGDQVKSDNCIKLQTETTRKLSISVQLSDPEEYEGGQLQFLGSNGSTFFAPKQKGTVIIFDSRISHRVRRVTKGVRKSLVGWVIGPRWR
jgi:hypothetical protein